MSARILVVDDVDINVKVLEAKLASEYFNVVTASNGKQALERAVSERPDVILLDVMMPGMDGFETCRRLKRDPATSDIPVVMVTALADSADRVRGIEAGADDFLTKPVSDVGLFARVRSLVRLKRMTDEWRLREETYGRLAELAEKTAKLVNESRPAQIVVLEDRQVSAQRILETLAGQDLVHVKRSAEVMAHATPAVDLFVLALSDKEDTLRTVADLRSEEATRTVPILMIGEEEELERLAKGLDLGATDYLVRPIDRNELVARVRTQVRRKRLQEQLRDTYQRSLSMALTDSLTGLYNRRYLMAHLEGLMARAAAGGMGPAVLMIDVDRFKTINDTSGHASGDVVLCEVARRASRYLRAFDLVARYGGEEFVVVMPDSSLEIAATIAERLRHTVADQPIIIPEIPNGLTVTVSIGVAAAIPGTGDSAAAVLKRADDALYAAKKSGRNRVMRAAENAAPPQPAAAARAMS